ncbi:KH domain-containing protein [Haloferula sp.]|uniref:KH domain-containing protein n=1 Tax=Haloferula sp. TaxID=2497595 RepID=UPI00329F8540
MATRISKFTNSLKQLGDIQVTDWDFQALLNKDLDLADSLRRLGNTKVIDLEFESVMPTFQKFAYREVEVPEVVKRAAYYKVLDWDFRSNSTPTARRAKSNKRTPNPEEMRVLMDRLRNFLQFVVVNLISEADRAEIRVKEIEPGVVRFKLLVTQKDVKDMIGRNGATASAIRNLLKATAVSEGIHALLDIQSHEEELAASRHG